MMTTAHPTPSSAAAHARAPASRPLELLEARRLRDLIASLLRKERSAMADFLIALSDFDRRRGWEPLGHPHLFAFLVAELHLSKSAAFYRKSAAELLQGFPEMIEPLRDGRLCLSTIAELAKVLTAENSAIVAPRFFGLSAREAQVLVAELKPRPAPPIRDLMTSVTREVGPGGPTAPAPSLRLELALSAGSSSAASSSAATLSAGSLSAGSSWAGSCSAASFPAVQLPAPPEAGPSDTDATPNTDPGSILTSEFPPNRPGRVAPRPDEIEPLTASLTRLHFTVRREVVRKVEAARRGLGHAIPNATLEQVLEAGLDLLLEKQAKARGQVKKPRRTNSTAPTDLLSSLQASSPQPTESPQPALAAQPAETAQPSPALQPTETARPTLAAQQSPSSQQTAAPFTTAFPVLTEPPLHRRDGPRAAIPAAVKRAVWARDAGRCCWPLDGGGTCGSTHRLELDHLVPWADWGGETEANLRLTCAAHNRLAARRAFGERVMGRYRGVREPVAEYGAASERSTHCLRS
jgi:hypothetical protein